MGNGRSIGVPRGLLRISMRLALGPRPNAQITLVYRNYSEKEKNATFFIYHYSWSTSWPFLEVLGPAVPSTPTSGCGKLVLVLWNATKTWDAFMFRSQRVYKNDFRFVNVLIMLYRPLSVRRQIRSVDPRVNWWSPRQRFSPDCERWAVSFFS